MTILTRFVSISVFVLLSITICNSQDSSEPWPLESENYYQGFNKVVSGTELDFFAFLSKEKISLYTGENGAYPFIEFTTEPVPDDYSDENISFIWGCSMGKIWEDSLSQYELFVNDQSITKFLSVRDSSNGNWNSTSSSGIKVTYRTTGVEKGKGDVFGYMFLTLPSGEFKPGSPATIKIMEIRSNAKDYYMAIQNPVVESAAAFAEPAIRKTSNGPKQTVKVNLVRLGPVTTGQFLIDGNLVKESELRPGDNEIYLMLEPVSAERVSELEIKQPDRSTITRQVSLNPVRNFEVYFLPHSHVDIGFTHKQAEVARLQWKNLDLALELVEKTKDYPERSKYKWNAEISWVLDTYLEQASPEMKDKLIKAVNDGSIGIDALYGSTLTGLQREEELFNNTLFANLLAKKYNLTVESAMITDVPGYTWGITSALAQTGIKYFSIGPNHMPHLPHGGYQVGHTFEAWGDIPFYWVSPSGKEKVLFWMSSHGYSWFHSWLMGNISHAGGTPVLNFLDELDQQGYPYDMVQLRYNIGNDNGPPDPDMPDFFKKWNETYEWPKFRIATTLEMMKTFEAKYADQIPEHIGDFTPYWEDGAASSATETALNRKTADRLVQAETLWALFNPQDFPVEKLDQAWKNIVLFSEHTWGANVSKSDPDSEFTKSLWKVKQGFVLDAHNSSESLITEATKEIRSNSDEVKSIQVVNTTSWARTELVTIPGEWQLAGNSVTDGQNNKVPSQILSNGDMVILAEQVPPFGTKTFRIKKGKPFIKGDAEATLTELKNDKVNIKVDPDSGMLLSYKVDGYPEQFLDLQDSIGFNTYWYTGSIKENPRRHYNSQVSVKESGPLVSSLMITSNGAGANSISQELRLVSGMDHLEIINTVDKLKIIENENVRFSFPFNIPDGKVQIDIPWAIMEPGVNQLKGANHNFYSVQRFVDVSNKSYGVTMATVDAPLLEIGDMNGQKWMEDMSTRPWIKNYEPSQKLYSWVMNNLWFVNYKAHQEGEIRFKYVLQPHGEFIASDAKKFGMEQTMPFIPVPVNEDAIDLPSFINITGSQDVIITSMKPTRDKKGWMVRLFNVSDKKGVISIEWKNKPSKMYKSSPLEESGDQVGDRLLLTAWEILTIRAEP